MKILLILVLVTAFANAYPRLPRQQFDDLEPLDEVVTQYQYRSQRYTPSPKLLSARNEYATDDGGLKSAAAPVLPYYRNNYGNNQDDIPDLSGIYSPDGLDSKRFRAVKTESRTQSAGDQVDENEKDPGPAQDKVLQYRTQADPSYYRNLLQNPPSYLINPSSVEASPVHHNAGDKHRDREPPEQLRVNFDHFSASPPHNQRTYLIYPVDYPHQYKPFLIDRFSS